MSAAAPGTTDSFVAPRYTPPPVRWGIPTAALVVLGFVAFVLLANVLVALTGWPAEFKDLGIWVLGYGLMLLVLWQITKRRGTGSWAQDYGLRMRWFDPLIGLGSGIGAAVIAGMLTAPVVALMGSDARSNDVAANENGLFLVLNGFIAVVVVAPFVEELLFRGLVMRSIRNSFLRGQDDPTRGRRVVAAVVAVVASSLVFAGVHLYEGWGSPVTMVSLGISTFVLGTVNAVYAATMFRLGPGIFTHATFNLLGALVATANAHS